MKQEQWTKLWRFVAAVALALSALATTLAGIAVWVPAEEAVPRAYQCEVYTEQGCSKYVVASGGEIEVQSGGTLDIQSGATTGLGAAMDLDSTLNVDGAVTFNSTFDVDGNVSSGTGAITMTDSVNITGAVDCDSTLNADGAVTFNSTVDIDGDLTSGTAAITIADSLNVTDTADFDSTVNIDGAVTLVSTASVGGDITLENGTTLGEAVDTVLDFSEFLAATEQTAVVVGTQFSITPTGTYQPLTSAAAVSTSLTTAILDGTVNGQLLILVNENASDAITIVDEANTKMGGDKVLTGGQGDAIFLMWDGADWLCIGYNDN